MLMLWGLCYKKQAWNNYCKKLIVTWKRLKNLIKLQNGIRNEEN